MRTAPGALLAKLVLTFALCAAAFYGMERDPWPLILAVSAVVTAVNYWFGDLFVLPGLGSRFAAIGDGFAAALLAWAAGFILPAFRTSFASLAMFAFLISTGEFFFHVLLRSEAAS